jgi:hypothetical protein
MGNDMAMLNVPLALKKGEGIDRAHAMSVTVLAAELRRGRR